MSLNTPMAGAAVNENQQEKPKRDWKRYNRAKQALTQSHKIPYDVIGMFLTLESYQGTKDHAFPTLRTLAGNASNDKVQRILNDMKTMLHEVVTVEQGKGKNRNSYKVTPFDKWPDSIINRLLPKPAHVPIDRTPMYRPSEHPMIQFYDSANSISNTSNYRERKHNVPKPGMPTSVNAGNNEGNYTCDNCGKTGLGFKSEMRGEYVFCNGGCYADWYQKNHGSEQ